MNGNIFDPRVNDIEEVINRYKHTMNVVNLYGPTHFSSIIETVNNICEADPGTYNN
jgi:tetrahydromethanopterin S-methyltransferase subunit A